MASLRKPLSEMQFILATDVGSTTTKARFFQRKGNEWRYIASGESPTTVEAPYEDVTAGVRNAVREVEELTDHRLLSKDGDESGILLPYVEGIGGVLLQAKRLGGQPRDAWHARGLLAVGQDHA